MLSSPSAWGGVPGAEKSPLQEIWTDLADNNLLDAASRFDGLPDATNAMSRLTGILVGMGRPPLSAGDRAEFRHVLKTVAQGDGEEAEIALYLLGRLSQVHSPQPDIEQAFSWYRKLAARNPGSHWAQLGMVKMGLMSLYETKQPEVAPEQKLEAARSFLPKLSDANLRRDLDLQIGWAGLYYEQPLAEVLPHLIAANEIGGLLGITPEDLTVQIGELAFRMGDKDLAERYFARFLRQYPSSIRRYNVEQRLVAIERSRDEAVVP